jgi:hypothetical protein
MRLSFGQGIALWITIAIFLATVNVCRTKDAQGNEILLEMKMTSGTEIVCALDAPAVVF